MLSTFEVHSQNALLFFSICRLGLMSKCVTFKSCREAVKHSKTAPDCPPHIGRCHLGQLGNLVGQLVKVRHVLDAVLVEDVTQYGAVKVDPMPVLGERKRKITTADRVTQVHCGLHVLQAGAPLVFGDQGPKTAEHHIDIVVWAVPAV